MVIVTPINFPVRFEGVTYKKGDTFEMAEKDVDTKILKVLNRVIEEVKAPPPAKGKNAPKAKGKEA